MDEPMGPYPMRINKYLAQKKLCTRREADELIAKGRVLLNGRVAVLGDKVNEGDTVETRFRVKKYRYFAFNKPRGVLTHSADDGEEDIAQIAGIPGVFPVGRLDKDSYGLIILTDDGRVTDALLNPKNEHEKEYQVTCAGPLPWNFKEKMEAGVDIGGYVTAPCAVDIVAPNQFRITLTEGKKHQIRRMCGAFGQSAEELERIRVMNIKLGHLAPGAHRAIEGIELKEFLKSIGLAP